MARRDLTNFNEVTQIVADAKQSIAQPLIESGLAIFKQSEEMRTMQMQTQFQLEANDLFNSIKTEYQSNPEQGRLVYEKQLEKLNQQYGKSVSPFFSGEWQRASNQLRGNSMLKMQNWAVGQAQKNTETYINNSLNNLYNTMMQAGMEYGETGGDLNVLLDYESQMKPLMEKATKYFGEEKAQEMFKKTNDSALKSFISGVADTNPASALQALEANKGAFENLSEYTEMRDALTEKVLNFQDRAIKQEIVNKVASHNDLFLSKKPMSYAQIQSLSNEMSEPAKKYFLKKNGYGKKSESLDKSGKLKLKGDIYNKVFTFAKEKKDTLDAYNGLSDLQDMIYDGLDKGAINETEANELITEILTPYNKAAESALEDFSSGVYQPWSDNVGYEELSSFYDKNIKRPIDKDKMTPTQVKRVEAINQKNKSTLVTNYYNALKAEASKRNISLLDIESLPREEYRKIYDRAYRAAKEGYLLEDRRVDIPVEDIKVLFNNADNPAAIKRFDELYGQGSANRVLGI